jgi:hypothetical protein
MRFTATSSEASLVANGNALHIANPWKIIIDTDEEVIIVSKRNWFLIGKDTQTLAFKYIRSINIDQHLIGADIHIKVVGGKASVFCLSKSDANRIKQILMEFNEKKKGKGIIFS